ncbi:triple tyrosine motif-containing protein [Clostridium aestuarii]|uniref:Triple tyrosine motif-containing protein n=1 Tax=Clostridium aestuarii TaxID=338193 RepID=A0ABT4CZI5_9CLOT|nr:triple tyrosine motif-containing protein [Clostridium aestuarii]MCY6484398.1 triple tyrosine motif-containing protein [Clostridium aestuarii]
MDEFVIGCNLESPQEKNAKIKINVLDKPHKSLLFKFMTGIDGAWKTLKDFSEEDSAFWEPEKDGKYLLMVQAKKEDSVKPFDYLAKREYIIGSTEENEDELITKIYLNKEKLYLGEKVELTVQPKKSSILYRYMIKKDEKWILAKDYCRDNTFIWSANVIGLQEILVQCKSVDSNEIFQDAKKIEFEIVEAGKLEIKDFRCLNSELLTDEELVFEVDSDYDDNRVVLYKFIKINSSGQVQCIQDYSTKKMVSYIEKKSDKYRLLCLAKDMYSPEVYDDRAIIYYEVKPYTQIEIQSFTSDLSSPQIMGKGIMLKAIVSGGKELRYRFIIQGNKNEDSGYIKSNEFMWIPKESGEYKLSLLVRDVSSSDKYEVKSSIEYVIDNIPREPVKIDDVVLDNKKTVLINESINIKVIAEGGTKLLYSFIVRKDNIEMEKINYGEMNWANFTPEEGGRFEVEIRVKDRYSDKKFDAHAMIHIDAYDYIPAKIDYILMDPKEYYLLGEQVVFNVITQDTCDTLLKYKLEINGHKVEETDYVRNKRYILKPKCSGRYVVKVCAKNTESRKEFDSIKEATIVVREAPPITNTKLKCDRLEFVCNDPVTATAESTGGKDVIYEFYLMEKGEWILTQKYSKKNYYTFIPFVKGMYKILVLAKSSYKKCSYEDYSTIEIRADEEIINENILQNINPLMEIKLK